MTSLQTELALTHKELREHIWSKWNRVLPFSEEIPGDRARWDKARFLGFGEGASIYESSYVYGDVKVGRKTWVGPFTILDGSGGLEIGEYCSISSGVQIYSHETVDWALSGGIAEYRLAKTRVGNCCFIGSLTVIRMGVTIGEHVLIGAHSLVNDNIPDNSIAIGCPARIIGRVLVRDGKVELKYDRKARPAERQRKRRS